MEQPAKKPIYKQTKWIVAGGVLLAAIVGGVVAAVLVTQDSGGGGSNPDKGAQQTTITVSPSPTATASAVPSPPPSTATPTTAPSMAPIEGTRSPSSSPSTSAPSASPSTASPSELPSENPTSTPTASPSTSAPTTSPSSAPTAAPTPVPANPVPDNPPKGYFNYDDKDKDYGPEAWGSVDTSDHFVKEFGKDGFGVFKGLVERDPTENRCGFAARNQSPKNLRRVAGGEEDGVCEAGHEIRTTCGTYPVDNYRYTRSFPGHKLSLIMNRRSCLEVELQECRLDNPPIADYPRYSASTTSYSDLLNYDIKINAEHSLEGEFFDAEIQMFHVHFVSSRFSNLAVPVRATADGYNEEFQRIINEFQLQYEEDAAQCESSRRNLRRAASTFRKKLMNVPEGDPGSHDWEEEYSIELDDPEFERNLQRRRIRFDPYSTALIPGITFFRYSGSLTEPPCMPITWWVMIDPMIISIGQLNQIKTLQLTHVDGTCKKTSVHNANQEVTRPIQPLGNDRGIQKCGEGSFESDIEKGRGDGNKC